MNLILDGSHNGVKLFFNLVGNIFFRELTMTCAVSTKRFTLGVINKTIVLRFYRLILSYTCLWKLLQLAKSFGDSSNWLRSLILWNSFLRTETMFLLTNDLSSNNIQSTVSQQFHYWNNRSAKGSIWVSDKVTT